MAVTVTPNLTLLNDAGDIGTAVGNKPGLETDLVKEGINSIYFTVTTNKYSGLTFTQTDLTNQHIRMWYNSAVGAVLDLKINGGLQFYVKDAAGNESYWYIGGRDTYLGGWLNIVQYLNYTDYPTDANNGTDAGLTTLVEAGVIINNTGVIRNVINTWIDYLRFGDGLTAYGDISTGVPFSIAEIEVADLAAGWGIVEENINGAYDISGKLILGDSAGVNLCNYEDSNKILIFADKSLSSTVCGIEVVGNATGDTDIIFANSVITTAAPLFDLIFNSINVESVVVSGCQIAGADELLLDLACNISGSTINACGLVTVEEATITDCTVSNSTATNALQYPDLVIDDNTARITFLDNINAILITTDVDHTLDGHLFSGNTYDINNTSGQAIIVFATNGSDAATFLGTVDIQNSVTVTLTGIAEGSEVSIQREGTITVEAYTASVSASGEFSYTFNSPPVGFTNIDIFIILPGYEWYPVYNLPLPSLSASLPINQQVDRNYVP